ncbi:MAG: response regulator [Verrucomicrobiota bacterium]
MHGNDKKHIVIVEDNISLCDVMRAYFELNYRVTVFPDGETCLAEVQNLKDADIFLLDYQLAHMSGIELFMALKPQLPNAKFMFTTGFLDPDIAEEGHRLGFDALILKPFDFPILEKNIQNLLQAQTV